MTILTAQDRDMKTKAKKLRREGFVPGIVCGREVKGKKTIQVAAKEAERLIRENQIGERITLQIGEEKMPVIIKDYTYNAMAKQIEVLDFQQLVKGEKIHTNVEVILENETLAQGVVTQELSTISYKADPEHLLDTIVLDFSKLGNVKLMKVSDLEQFKDPEVTPSNPDAVVFSVTQSDIEVEDDDADENAVAAE